MLKRIILPLLAIMLFSAATWFWWHRDDLEAGWLRTYHQVREVARGTPQVIIQPYRGIDTATVAEVKRAIEKYYGFEVQVQPPVDLPEYARTTNIAALRYHRPSPQRFRADTLLRHLKKLKPADADYIMGLTASDISTTKKRNGKIKEPTWMYTDWGIFGLGFRPGSSCVLSTYRLGRDTYDQSLIRTRLRKIATHELGHNLGLKHCPNPQCFMRDAQETMRTIDAAPESLCTDCKKQIDYEF